MVRVSDAHLFLAMCEMCAFRYRQHSSRDKPLGPHPFNPHPPQSLHPPCLLKCVCVRVYVGLGSACPVPQHFQGAIEKTAVCLRETENVRKREWRANRHASQDLHFWSEYHKLCCSVAFVLLHAHFISFPVTLSHRTSSVCLLHLYCSYLITVFVAVFCFAVKSLF